MDLRFLTLETFAVKPRTFNFLSDHCTTVQREDKPFTHPTMYNKCEYDQFSFVYQ